MRQNTYWRLRRGPQVYVFLCIASLFTILLHLVKHRSKSIYKLWKLQFVERLTVAAFADVKTFFNFRTIQISTTNADGFTIRIQVFEWEDIWSKAFVNICLVIVRSHTSIFILLHPCLRWKYSKSETVQGTFIPFEHLLLIPLKTQFFIFEYIKVIPGVKRAAAVSTNIINTLII